ncbi:DUF6261 family protein [Flaviaesturariibacter aridisoli]|uniref:Uncharacterized protein n=1 Tax=Flaviaesturariibacter aridisoli TaxID=2545761 RepID=A0A4R4E9L5_9BACT|nr:DUF6261 family protein [Flaviaesturariibacter aridisoli]TCZ74538.1 hypothetical protein E0486_02625 [Flaviaesturariibacter aridisoli]
MNAFRKSRTGTWPNATFLGFFEGANVLVEKCMNGLTNTPDAFAEPYAAFRERLVRLGGYFKLGASSLSGQLQRVDAHRDGQYNGLRAGLRMYTYHEDAEVAAAATLVEANMDLYGTDLTRQSYMNETVAISNLLKDWRDKPELAGALRALPALESFRARLERDNSEFHELYLKRVAENASAPEGNTGDAQAEVIKAYELVLRKIAGFMEVSADPSPWMKLQKELDTLWEQYANAEAIRMGKAAAAAERNTVPGS